MDRFFEMTFGQLVAGAVETWLAVAYVFCMFAVVAFRPQQIRDAFAFRRSYTLFALYLILPATINALAFLTMSDNPRSSGVGTTLVLQFSVIAGRVLLASCIIKGLASVRPSTYLD